MDGWMDGWTDGWMDGWMDAKNAIRNAGKVKEGAAGRSLVALNVTF